jgi:hypothetical protein
MTYAERTGREQDFDVHYRFFSSDAGGRKSVAPRQGYRCDWSYDGDDTETPGIYMIWPEFEADDGSIIALGEYVPLESTARMWIVSSEMREEIHRGRIFVGTRGFFMEGGRRVAEAVVTRIVGLRSLET